MAREGPFKEQNIMNVVEYFRSAYAELKKVAWPSRKETIRYSALVVAISIIVALFFAFLDKGLERAVQGLLAGKSIAPQAQEATPTTQPLPTTLPSDIQAVTPSGAPAEVTITPEPVK